MRSRDVTPLLCRLGLHAHRVAFIRCYRTPDIPGHDGERMQRTVSRCARCGLLTQRTRRLRKHEPTRRLTPPEGFDL